MRKMNAAFSKESDAWSLVVLINVQNNFSSAGSPFIDSIVISSLPKSIHFLDKSPLHLIVLETNFRMLINN